MRVAVVEVGEEGRDVDRHGGKQERTDGDDRGPKSRVQTSGVYCVEG